MNKFHEVASTRVEEEYFYLTVDGSRCRIRWTKCSPRLARASLAQRKHFALSPSGYGIHWPEIDEDLAITPLLKHAERLSASVHRTTQQAAGLHSVRKTA
ncbi:MAG: DUF2442 domain-containing protein [Chloroflexota bacterium]|nr:DUF2442 domain-containing protein [Chloroflexota bacterium]